MATRLLLWTYSLFCRIIKSIRKERDFYMKIELNDFQVQMITEMAEQDYKLYTDFHNRPKDLKSWEIFSVWIRYEAMFSMYLSKLIGYRYCSSAPELSGVYTGIKPTKESVKAWFLNLPDQTPATENEKHAEADYEFYFDLEKLEDD